MFLFLKEKQLTLAIKSYQNAKYDEAETLLNQSLSKNENDIYIVFWKMRVAVRQKKYEQAICFVNICKKYNIYKDFNELLIKWEQQCLAGMEKPEIIEMNVLDSETNALLEKFQHYRKFGLGDVVLVVLVFIGGLKIVDLFNLASIFEIRQLANFLCPLYSLFILWYYNRKSILVAPIHTLERYSAKQVARVVCSSYFLFLSFLIFIVITLRVPRGHTMFGYSGSLFDILRILLWSPIFEEVFFRGILYGWLRKYGKNFSWLVTSILFYLASESPNGFFPLIFSFFSLSIYEKEKTIIAPILFNGFTNCVFIILQIMGNGNAF